MKPVYRRHVQDVLADEVPRAFPGFSSWRMRLSEEQRKSAVLFPGSRLFGCKSPHGVTFIHVIPHRRQEVLLAEVGWAVSGQFPAHLSSHGSLAVVTNEFEQADWLVDFRTLYYRQERRAHLGWPVWDCSVPFDHPDFTRIFVEEDLLPVTEEQGRSRSAAAVKALIQDVRQVAIPYLNEWMSRRSAL